MLSSLLIAISKSCHLGQFSKAFYSYDFGENYNYQTICNEDKVSSLHGITEFFTDFACILTVHGIFVDVTMKICGEQCW